MYCSNCNSADIRKLSLVYESGLSFVDTSTTGVGFAGGGLGVGGAHTKGTHVTAISQKAAPPTKQSYGPAVFMLVATAMLALIWHLWVIGVVLAIVMVVGTSDYNKKKWPPLYAAWDQKYLCGRCGAMMVPTLQAPKLIENAPQSVQTLQHEQLPPA